MISDAFPQKLHPLILSINSNPRHFCGSHSIKCLMSSDEVIIDLVHRDNRRIIYFHPSHHLFPFANAPMHPLKHVIQALLQCYICDMLTGLVMIIELLVEGILVSS